MGRPWTKVEEQIIIRAYQEGISPMRIARALDRSYNSVTCKLRSIKVGYQ